VLAARFSNRSAYRFELVAAEYIALTQLQADAFVTLDAELARRAEGIVPTATIVALRTA
jgi:hypothetical protein